MRKRKIRQWMINLIRIELGQNIPPYYKSRPCIGVGTSYSYAIASKRKWLQSCLQHRQYYAKKIWYIHEIVNFRPEFRSKFPNDIMANRGVLH